MRDTKTMLITLASLSLACGGQQTDQIQADAVAADPDHYTVEFENDAARILRITYGPGETSVMHRHPANCRIFLSGQPGTMETPDGNVEETEAGDVGALSCGDSDVHLPTNTGDGELELILVELKEGATAGAGVDLEAPDAVAVDPDHYTVEFENDVVRMIRIAYQPGDTSVMHSHAANCVVWLAAQLDNFGEVACTDAQEHQPEGATDGPIELVAIEFKGRASVSD